MSASEVEAVIGVETVPEKLRLWKRSPRSGPAAVDCLYPKRKKQQSR